MKQDTLEGKAKTKLRPCSLDHIKLISFEIGLYPLDSLLPTKIMLPFLLKL